MTKLVFGLIALSCFFASVAAGTTQIQLGSYTDNTCTTLSYPLYNYTAGECKYNSFEFVASADNAYVFEYIYASGTTGCPIANISAIGRIEAGVCGATAGSGSSFTKFTILTDSVNPSPPTTFPPSGFSVVTQYLNLTTSKPADTCDTTRTLAYAVPSSSTTSCRKISGGSTQSFMDTCCTTTVTAIYSDDSCTNIVRVSSQPFQFQACEYGIPQTCTGTGIPSFPSTLTIGYTQYDNNQCTSDSKTITALSTDGGCFRGSSITCGMVNGTQTLIATTYTNSNCTGAITNTTYITTGICSLDASAPNMTATCAATPLGPFPTCAQSSTGSAAPSTSSTGSGPSGPTTQIQYANYYDNACTQPNGVFTNYTAGACQWGMQSFPDSTNNYVYSYFYDHLDCTGAIVRVKRYEVGVCGAQARYGGGPTMYTIYTGPVNPPAPTPFPPLGFQIETMYLNSTDSRPDNTCSSSRTVLTAHPPNNPCHKSWNGLTSFQSFNDSTCSTEVTAFYSDPNCTNVASVTSRQIQFLPCEYGIPQTCTGTGIPSFPSTFTIGYSAYDNNQCITNSNTITTVVSNGGCSNYVAFTCDMVNGTQMVIVNQYANSNCTGSTLDTIYLATDVCIVDNGQVQNMTATCNATPIGPTPTSSSTAGTVSASSSTGSSGGVNGSSSSTGPGSGLNSGDLTRSVSFGSIMMVMVVGLITSSYYGSD